ncbi:unnamed protein product [Ilex paraguariensis]|uniref:tRNA/rRNA methyltransferase SpoU type domain-containing protein n=1 Tax=Ilex paraguariensis TaxID=185542 RepID=A0ABC8TLP5_9AQUA
MSRVLFEHMTGRYLVSWNTMIAAYGMHGRCVQALKLFDQMKKENVVPDDLTFRSVLAACSHSGLVEEGLHIFRSMKEEYSMIPSEEHYGCVIDLLSRAGRLEEAYDLLQCLPPRQSASALGALLAACRVYGNSEMGETVGSGEVLEELDPHILDVRKERFRNLAKNRSYSVCLLVEGLCDFGNVSATFWSVDALGFQSVHVVPCDSSKRYGDNRHVSMGGEKWLDIKLWNSTERCFKVLKSRGYRIATTHVGMDAVSIYDMDWSCPTAIVVGNENRKDKRYYTSSGCGLSSPYIRLRIPVK